MLVLAPPQPSYVSIDRSPRFPDTAEIRANLERGTAL